MASTAAYPSAAAPVAAPAPAAAAAAAAAPAVSSTSASSTPLLDISVADPVRQGEGVGAFVSYKVRSRHSSASSAAAAEATAAGFAPAAEAVRRFRDFAWLRAALAATHRGTIIPPLPERSAVQKFAMSPAFVEARRAALEVFLRRCAAHPRLRSSRELRLFLEAPEDEFALEVARSAAAGGPGPGGAPGAAAGAAAAGAQRAAAVAAGWMRSLTGAASALVAGARAGSGGGVGGAAAYGSSAAYYPSSTVAQQQQQAGVHGGGAPAYYADAMGFGGAAGGDGAAGVGTAGVGAAGGAAANPNTTALSSLDPEFARVREYLAHLEAHLSEAHKHAARLVRKEQEVGEAVAAFGASVERLGRLEDGAGPHAQEAFAALGRKASALASSSAARALALARGFEAPLKEAARGARAAQEACADRQSAADGSRQAQHELDARKVRWARLRGTPGTPPDRLAEAERDTADAERRLRAAYQASVSVGQALEAELGRWQRERAAATAALLRRFAEEQAGLAADGARLWGALLAELQALLGAQARVQEQQQMEQQQQQQAAGVGAG
jgi:hypothetical protein